jgi:hypothetical protein
MNILIVRDRWCTGINGVTTVVGGSVVVDDIVVVGGFVVVGSGARDGVRVGRAIGGCGFKECGPTHARRPWVVHMA